MPRPKKPWSKVVEEGGVSVRLYERAAGLPIYREVRTGGGAKDRKSLGHSDKALAEREARALAQRMSELRFAGHTAVLTLGQLTALYQRDRVPMLSATRQRTIRGMLRLLEKHFGRTMDVNDLSPHLVAGYVAARESGRLKSPRHRTPRTGASAGTIRNELQLLAAMLRWGQGVRVGGRRLVTGDPLAGITIPTEKNAMRPLATEARYRALLKVAEQAEATGRFRCVLTLARTTGRRISAICALRRRDVLLSTGEMRRALAAAGLSTANADHWPNGAIVWSAANDKLGFSAVTPISSEARAALDAYLRTRPSLGDAPLFPGLEDVTRPIGKELAGYWLRRVEKIAKLEHMERGGYHAFRRLWASERRHLPAQDVAAAGGWRSLEVMRSAYQHADAETVYPVVESRTSGHTPDTLASEVKQAQ
jgi:integrase